MDLLQVFMLVQWVGTNGWYLCPLLMLPMPPICSSHICLKSWFRGELTRGLRNIVEWAYLVSSRLSVVKVFLICLLSHIFQREPKWMALCSLIVLKCCYKSTRSLTKSPLNCIGGTAAAVPPPFRPSEPGARFTKNLMPDLWQRSAYAGLTPSLWIASD